MKIYLIRHGESIMNTRENDNIGEIDSKVWLTERGLEQAEKSAKFLKAYMDGAGDLEDTSKMRVWVSPYRRTRETFEVFDNIVGFKEKGITCFEDFLLAEQEFGLFDNVPIDKWEETYPTEYAYYKKLKDNGGKFYARCPMGESPKDVAIRCRIFSDTIWRDYHKSGIETLCLFVHGTVLRSFTMAWNHYSPEWYNTEGNPGNCWIRLIDNHTDKGYIFNE